MPTLVLLSSVSAPSPSLPDDASLLCGDSGMCDIEKSDPSTDRRDPVELDAQRSRRPDTSAPPLKPGLPLEPLYSTLCRMQSGMPDGGNATVEARDNFWLPPPDGPGNRRSTWQHWRNIGNIKWNNMESGRNARRHTEMESGVG